MLRAIYDACVLYPAPLRDFLMRLAEAQLCHAAWTKHIHEEWTRNVLKNRPDLRPETLARTCEMMDRYAIDSLVTGYEDLIETLTLPDENDRHVLAAAIKGNASMIVTANIRDFPESALEPHGITAISPDDFIFHLITDSPREVIAVVQQNRSDLKRPPKTAEEHLATLEKQGLSKTVAFLREHVSEI